ncbi:DNA/pantothenate metabolism flavoprotein [Suillus subaureus]|uniref:DNA/pantothenate metabolism flavoprotein n=1 Tax=Suillus subaureus TaxID=48587 RepID=A0A9P7E5K7_9AGAM|nr:DNA/pantothenate metabolism flavoprotein [Suillus subaureus]KAG1811277.1 DNA/pantothenate metabolism flavoprotein [Suillus subaureus]
MSNTTHESQTFSAESYFETQPQPPSLVADTEGVHEFIQRQQQANRSVVLVTSGGTTVPLELNVVRFLDNFSAGTRGATSAEYFLKAGYAVIFLHRQFSLQPFSRHYSHSTNPFLNFLEIDAALPSSSTIDSAFPYSNDPPPTTPTPQITVTTAERAKLFSVLRAYKAVHALGTLHMVSFVTVNEYLWLLRAVSREMSVLGRKAMYYLAAAVSDFFLPQQRLSEHKIQSGKGNLSIEMDQVPKILKPLVSEWNPEGFIVSFKLETDEMILIPKAQQALERYGHQVVIGNDLHHRKHRVVLISPVAADATKKLDGALVSQPKYAEFWIEIDSHQPSNHPKEIEEDIIEELLKRHNVWIEGS